MCKHENAGETDAQPPEPHSLGCWVVSWFGHYSRRPEEWEVVQLRDTDSTLCPRRHQPRAPRQLQNHQHDELRPEEEKWKVRIAPKTSCPGTISV